MNADKQSVKRHEALLLDFLKGRERGEATCSEVLTSGVFTAPRTVMNVGRRLAVKGFVTQGLERREVGSGPLKRMREVWVVSLIQT